MRKFCSYQNCIFGVLFCLAFNIYGANADENRKLQAWETPDAIKAILNNFFADIDSTYPAPSLFQEPDYTLGRDNTVYWNTDETKLLVESDTISATILFFEIQAHSDSCGTLWGFVDNDVDSATFRNLPAGISIYYRLRYYAQDSTGNYCLSQWSLPERSIQDISPPIFSGYSILDLKISGEKKWVDQQTLQIRIEASDPDSGQVMQVVFNEKYDNFEYTLYHDLQPPSEDVDVEIFYTMNAPENELTEFSFWVIDVAGQESSKDSVSLFWWHNEEMVCFPNPFNPDNNEMSTIEGGLLDVTEARIYDPFGHLVRVLIKENSVSFFEWDGTNGRGELVSNGGYICIVQGEDQRYCKIAVLR